jgi:hypothetical protein
MKTILVTNRVPSAVRQLPAPEQHEETNLQRRYDALSARVSRLSQWLSGPDAPTGAHWDAGFARYREHATELRRLGDQLRPVSLRDRSELLSGTDLANEVLELLAA